MSEQPDFPETDRSRNRTPLFFALLLRSEDQLAMREFTHECCHEEGLTGTPAPTSRLHVSLHAVGDFSELPDRVVRTSTAAAASIDASAFSVAFDRTMSFAVKQPTKPFVLCASDGMMALEDLHTRLGRALWTVGLGQHVSRRFTPHITLLYDRRSVPERHIFPVTMHFDEFVLIHSLVGPRRHVHVARWPLRD